jgi:CheY-like chemotaxis protein
MGSRVIVVEDSPEILELLAFYLRAGGFDVREASDGQEALEMAREDMPDAVVTDLMMPRLDGAGFIDELRKEPGAEGIPAVVVTAARSDDPRVANLRGLPAVEVIHKPPHWPSVAEVVRKLIGEDGHGPA